MRVWLAEVGISDISASNLDYTDCGIINGK